MDPLTIALRFFHIVGGALWVGSAFLFIVYIGPAAAKVGPSSGPLLSEVVKKRRVGWAFNALIASNVIAGWWLWLRNVEGYGSVGAFVATDFGLVLTIGGLLATTAGVLGFLGTGRSVERLVELGDTVRASGGPPSDQQQAELARLGANVRTYGLITLALLILAISAMATARYW
ncbi:MAG TPA: hypothetical protein VFO05_17305 [Candidatus Limnocylindrales bacterium]|nr:hypothetical protein [Candidatus Limnocylindrales bacterium]